MTPLPNQSKLVLLIQNGVINGAQTNVDPNMEVVVCTSKESFERERLGVPFEVSKDSLWNIN